MSEFKIGDKVIVVKSKCNGALIKGMVGKIVAYDGTKLPYKVKLSDFKNVWCYNDDIKLYEEQPKVNAPTTEDVSTITLTEEALKEQPLTDFGYTPNKLPSKTNTVPNRNYTKSSTRQETTIDSEFNVKGESHYRVLGVDLGVDYLELYNKLSTKQYKKLEKVALKIEEIGDKIGADYHEMLELLKRHF